MENMNNLFLEKQFQLSLHLHEDMRAAVELTPGTLCRSGRGGDLALATSLDSRVSTGGAVTVSSSSTTDTYLHSPALAVWRAHLLPSII